MKNKKRLTERERLERNKKIKEKLFVVIHSIGYLCIAFTIFICIALGVSNCSKKNNASKVNNINEVHLVDRLYKNNVYDRNYNAWYQFQLYGKVSYLRGNQFDFNLDYAYNFLGSYDFSNASSSYKYVSLRLYSPNGYFYDVSYDGNASSEFTQLYLNYYFDDYYVGSTLFGSKYTLTLSSGNTAADIIYKYNPNDVNYSNPLKKYNFYFAMFADNIYYSLYLGGMYSVPNIELDYGSLLVLGSNWYNNSFKSFNVNDFIYRSFPLLYIDYELSPTLNLIDLFGSYYTSYFEENGINAFRSDLDPNVNGFSVIIGADPSNTYFNELGRFTYFIGDKVCDFMVAHATIVNGKQFTKRDGTFVNIGTPDYNYYFFDALQGYDLISGQMFDIAKVETSLTPNGIISYNLNKYVLVSRDYSNIRLFRQDFYSFQFDLLQDGHVVNSNIPHFFASGLLPNQLLDNLSNSALYSNTAVYSDVFNLFSLAFRSWASIFNIALLPNLTIGVLLFIPLIVTIIVIVFRIIKK